MGTIQDSVPTPIPLLKVSSFLSSTQGAGVTYVINRPASISLCPPAIAVTWTTTPRIKTPVAIKIPYLREQTSAMKPDMTAPNQAPSSRMAVSQPFWVGLSMYPSVSGTNVNKVSEILFRWNIRTFAKGWHSQNTSKHTLVVTVKHTSQASEQSNTEDLEVLDKSSWATLAH